MKTLNKLSCQFWILKPVETIPLSFMHKKRRIISKKWLIKQHYYLYILKEQGGITYPDGVL